MNGTWLPRECVLGSLESSVPFEVSADGQRSRVDPHGTMFVDENGVTLRGWIDSEDLKLWGPDARVQLAVGNAETWIVMECQGDRLCVIVVHAVWEPAPVQGTRRLPRVRLFPRSFVLYRPWIPGEHRRGICAVECVTAHLRGFEEDSRSEVVFWIDEWSIEFGC